MAEPTANSSVPADRADDAPAHDLRAVLRIAPFRKLWICLGLSSLGDWLGLLALTAMASQLAGGSYASANFAIAGVLLLRLLPAVVIGPLGGFIADRLDRRWTLVVGDVLRFALFASIPLAGNLVWLYVATLLIEAVSLVWLPAKDAAVPNLVPRERLAAANQISLATTYGSALPAAALFTLLSLLNKTIERLLGGLGSTVDLALYFNALTFLIGALVVAGLREVSGRPLPHTPGEDGQSNMLRSILDGWKYVGSNRLVRGLVIGIVGAFATGGVVIGLGRTFVADLKGGDAGYGVLFGGVFLGLAIGMGVGPRLLGGFSRKRLFGLSLIGAGVMLTAMALIQNLVIVSGLVVALGFFAGVSWITGYTMLGTEVDDSIRGRTFAFVQSMTRVALAAVLAVAPALAGTIGTHRLPFPEDVQLSYNGASITIFVSAIAIIAVGYVSYRQMDDRRGVPLARDLRAAIRGHDRGVFSDHGLFVAIEGGEGAGKSTQLRLLADWLRQAGYSVTVTHQPGATPIGLRLRELVLGDTTGPLSPRTEALLFAADKAEHVTTMIRPDLEGGNVVITDRYIDSALAYQGGGRELSQSDVLKLNRWATGGLRPHVTILLDLPPEVGVEQRTTEPADRLEREPLEFHERVRQGFLDLAALDPDRYAVIDATRSPEEIAERIREQVEPLLGQVHIRRVGEQQTEQGAL
ncbi:bifunctional MFS transporter/dTMP kinase [Flindersiella endophytica]